jgi:PAS domain S-box-containing protein
MTDAPHQYEALIARLSTESALAHLSEPGAGVLVWDLAVDRLLWATPAARGLRDAFTDQSGHVSPDLRARDRLRALAQGLAPREGARMERLRLDPARPWLPVACACRVAEAEPGRAVLVTAIMGPVPRTAPRGRLDFETDETLSVEETDPDIPAASNEIPVSQAKSQGTIRFIWQTDADTRFTHVSPSLAEAVGPVAADIVGRSWKELSGAVVEDPGGAVGASFARRETWSGLGVAWRMDNSSMRVPFDWAGMPVFGPDRELVGFRGFGLVRRNALSERAAETGESNIKAQTASVAEIQSEPEQGSSEAQERTGPGAEEGWFAHLRDRVTEALSGSKPHPDPQAASGAETTTAATGKQANPTPGLSHAERAAFREIARALGARFEQDMPSVDAPVVERTTSLPPASAFNGDRVLDRLPIGILVCRDGAVLFANRFFLHMTGYGDIERIRRDGGLARLFGGSPSLLDGEATISPVALIDHAGESIAVDVRLSDAEWDSTPAVLMLVRKIPDADATERLRVAEMDLRQRESRMHELESILDTATDGVIVLDETGRILSLNRSAEALFGYDQREVVGDAITVLLAPESHIVALDYLEGLRSPGVASLLNDGREVLGRVRQGGTIPLFMTMGRVNDGPDRKFCAVLRDITAFKKAEGELVGAKRAAEEASAQKSDLLAKISHEIRTPLNAILGFAEVMLEERFGPVGNERYKEYLKDVHASGAHVISLVNDLLDLAKVEAGRLELSFTSVSLNDLVSSCFMLLQPQATRDRIVMRTSFAAKLPPVVADERSVRQIVLNLVSNAIKFTDAGGQVIVSTALTDRGEVAFRVRDTGIGMTETEIEAALEPFRQLATSRKRGGTGLGLPLTKALVEANRGTLQISSHPSEGTLVEVIFPPTRVLAE